MQGNSIFPALAFCELLSTTKERANKNGSSPPNHVSKSSASSRRVEIPIKMEPWEKNCMLIRPYIPNVVLFARTLTGITRVG